MKKIILEEALAKLAEAYPHDSINIGLEVWSHYHDDGSGRAQTTVEWSVWINSHARNYYASTLEGVVVIALALAVAKIDRPAVSLVRAAETAVGDLP